MKRSICSVLLALALSAPVYARAAADGKPDVIALPANDHVTVAMAIRFRAGAIDDPPGKAGLTYLTAGIMGEGGTRALDAKQLLMALFPMAADIGVTVDKELTTFHTVVHKDHLGKMVPIFTDVVAHPRWDAREFERLKEAVINDVEKRLRQGDDENLGKESLWELLYAGHPYGRLTHGHLKDLKSITLDEVKAHAARLFALDRMELGVAGGYPKDLPAQLEQALASLPAKGAPQVAVGNQAPAARPRVRLVEKDTESTAISIGFPWKLSRKDPDFVALTVARSAFGEHRQFNGRLMQRLREARGLNYGDYAYLEHYEQEGGDAATAQTGRVRHQQAFSIWVRPVQNENRLFALRAALYELNRSLSAEPFTAEEVEQTKGFLDGYVLLFAQTDARKLGYAMDDHFLGVDNFLNEWHAKLASVTAAQVNAAWKKWVDPARAQILMVTPGAAAVKKAIVTNALSPIHYQKDEQGNTPPKPKALLEADAKIQTLPIGVKGDADVDVVSVDKAFE